MFYTEYRPQKFGDLIGLEHVVESITGALASGRPAHAYFFTGSRGVGKTSVARILAKALNCTDPQTKLSSATPSYVKFEPCLKCKSCTSIKEGNNLDLIEIDAASNRGIDDIRTLKDNINLSPTGAKNKIYIIDEVHMLTTEASNALLKTLEEPPSHAYFVLCTTNPEKVLTTIKSRCQQFQFTRPTIDEISNKLKLIAKDNKYEISDEQVKRIAIVAKGAYREAETILEQMMSGDKHILELLNEQESNYYELTSLLLGGQTADAIKFVYEVYQRGVSLENWTEKYVEYLRALILEKLQVKSVDNSFDLNNLEKQLAMDANLNELKVLVERFSLAIREFKDAVLPTLPLELAAIDVTKSMSQQEATKPSGTDGPIGSAKTEGKESPVTSKVESADKSPKVNPFESASKVRKEESADTSTVASTSTDKPASPEPSKSTKKSKTFDYKGLIEKIKPENHSIHLILSSCEFINFDGENLRVSAFYSFHKERLMTNKIRDIVEKIASEICGVKVVFWCDMSDKKPEGKRLTDKNVMTPEKSSGIENVFEEVFGDDLVTAS